MIRQELSLKDLLPSSLAQYEEIKQINKVLQTELMAIISAIPQVLLMPNIKNLTGDILEHLAWAFNLEAAEGWLLADTDSKKQDLILNAIEVQRYKGTKYAIKKSLEIVGLNGEIKEWFEYQDSSIEPFHFTITIDGTQKYSPEQMALLDRYVIQNKNVRSWVSIVIASNFNSQLYYAGGILHEEIIELYPAFKLINKRPAYASAILHAEIIEIHPKSSK